jgi:hypothetical protein
MAGRASPREKAQGGQEGVLQRAGRFSQMEAAECNGNTFRSPERDGHV